MSLVTPTVRAVLWDFGDTLCDERWMLKPLAGHPAWADLYRQVLSTDNLVDRWDRGTINADEVAAAVADRLDIATETVAAHMAACCRDIAFYGGVMRLVDRITLPQALVTINPDIFSKIVVPAYALHQRFRVIVTSWQEGTTDKARLCAIAMARLDPGLRPEQCLLVDNRAENIEGWEAVGGPGLRFIDEKSLLAEWPL